MPHTQNTASAAELATRLGFKKRGPNDYRRDGICHGGSKDGDSLQLFDGKDGPAFKCYKDDGCSIEIIKRALGIWQEPKPRSAATETPSAVSPDKPLDSAIYRYRNADGSAHFAIHRIVKIVDGKRDKTFRFQLPDGEWRRPEVPSLFNLDKIAADTEKAIVWHEGEKAACAGEKKAPGLLHTTSAGGADNPHLTDISALAGRVVYLAPDHDSAGAKWRAKVELLAIRAGADVLVLDVSNTPAKSDMAEWSAVEFGAMAAAARPPGPRTYRTPELAGLGDPRDYILESLMREGALSLWSAKSGVGKSSLMRALAACVADGHDDKFLERDVLRNGDVLMVWAEEDPYAVAEYYAKLGIGGERIHWMIPEDFPSMEERMTALEITIAVLKPALVVIDTALRFLPTGFDENAMGETSALLQALQTMVRPTKTHIALLHHEGHLRNGPMGSTGWSAVPDVLVSLTNPNKWERSGYIEVVKGRFGIRLAKRRFRIDGDNGWFSMGRGVRSGRGQGHRSQHHRAPARESGPDGQGDSSRSGHRPEQGQDHPQRHGAGGVHTL